MPTTSACEHSGSEDRENRGALRITPDRTDLDRTEKERQHQRHKRTTEHVGVKVGPDHAALLRGSQQVGELTAHRPHTWQLKQWRGSLRFPSLENSVYKGMSLYLR